jgi:RimJ/RimL family protein N-acetyltransferase
MTLNPPRTFDTRRLILRKPVFDDAPAVFRAYANDPEVTRYITWPPARSISDTEIAMRELLAAWESGIEYSWALILKDTNQLIGMISIRPSGFWIDLGYVLGRQFWGKGYMTEAGAVMIDWLFTQSDIFRVGATCDVDNLASARVLEKLGMQLEGVLRKWSMHPNISDEPRDCLSYSRVKASAAKRRE